MKIETKLELESAMFEFKGGTVTMNLKGRLHPLGYHNPDSPTFYAQKTFRVVDANEDKLLASLVALVELEFGSQVEGTSDNATPKEGGSGEGDSDG